MVQTKKKGSMTWEEFKKKNYHKQEVIYTDDPSEFLELLKGKKHGTRKQ